MSKPARSKARRRALRAAQVVTLGLAIAGCGESHELDPDAGPVDAAPDVVVVDSGGPDATCAWPPTTEACCAEEPGGYWDEATEECWVAVPGPFIPPAMPV